QPGCDEIGRKQHFQRQGMPPLLLLEARSARSCIDDSHRSERHGAPPKHQCEAVSPYGKEAEKDGGGEVRQSQSQTRLCAQVPHLRASLTGWREGANLGPAANKA